MSAEFDPARAEGIIQEAEILPQQRFVIAAENRLFEEIHRRGACPDYVVFSGSFATKRRRLPVKKRHDHHLKVGVWGGEPLGAVYVRDGHEPVPIESTLPYEGPEHVLAAAEQLVGSPRSQVTFGFYR